MPITPSTEVPSACLSSRSLVAALVGKSGAASCQVVYVDHRVIPSFQLAAASAGITSSDVMTPACAFSRDPTLR